MAEIKKKVTVINPIIFSISKSFSSELKDVLDSDEGMVHITHLFGDHLQRMCDIKLIFSYLKASPPCLSKEIILLF
jgi:hypothetical protein